MSRDADLAFAHALADAADAITLARFRALDLRVDTKPDLTPVSDADRAAEEAIRDLIARERPRRGRLGEEFGDDGTATRWIVDPIDGTMNFLRGVPVWATLLALERDGAGRGRARLGARARPPLVGGPRRRRRPPTASRCRVSRVARIEDCAASTTSAREHAAGLGGRSSRRAWAIRGLGDFWQHCLVAEGALDVAVDRIVALWDYAAIALIVRGGGRPLHDLRRAASRRPSSSFLSTNGALHDAAVALLRG